MKRLFASAAAASLALVTPSAHAEFGDTGDVAFAADRLTGFWLHSEGNFDGNALGLGASPGGWYRRYYAEARLGVDGVIVSHLTLGGNLALWNYGGDADGTAFLIYPRVGYVIQFNESWGFWPRGGITVSNGDAPGPGDDDEVALSFEAVFYGSPVEHFAFTFGPNVDIGLVGDGAEARSFGIISAGVLGWL